MKQPRTPNVLKVWKQSTEGEREYGEQWYRVAHGAAYRIGLTFGCRTAKVVGVISALSPSNPWHRNLTDAEAYCRAHSRNERRPTASTYSNGQRKAWAILQDEYDDPLEAFETGSAWKTRAFYLSILNPHKSLDTVVVDGHAWNISTNQRVPLNDVGHIGKGRYHACARAYVRAAVRENVKPQAMQATTWLTWRRLNGYSLDFDADLLLTTERI